MNAGPELLLPNEDTRHHAVAAIEHYRGDIALLNYLLHDLRVLVRRSVKGEIDLAPQQVLTWEVHGLGRRTVVCDPAALRTETQVNVVGFFGDRRAQTDHGALDASEYDLISEFVHHPGIMSYSSIELVDNYWANLVVHRNLEDREAWRGSEAHKLAVDNVAPSAYHSVRIHNGCIGGGIIGSKTVVIDSTKYWDYDSTPTWHAIRPLPSGASVSLDGPIIDPNLN